MGVEVQHHVHYAHFDQSGVRKIFTVNYVWGHTDNWIVLEGKLKMFLDWTKERAT